MSFLSFLFATSWKLKARWGAGKEGSENSTCHCKFRVRSSDGICSCARTLTAAAMLLLFLASLRCDDGGILFARIKNFFYRRFNFLSFSSSFSVSKKIPSVFFWWEQQRFLTVFVSFRSTFLYADTTNRLTEICFFHHQNHQEFFWPSFPSFFSFIHPNTKNSHNQCLSFSWVCSAGVFFLVFLLSQFFSAVAVVEAQCVAPCNHPITLIYQTFFCRFQSFIFSTQNNIFRNNYSRTFLTFFFHFFSCTRMPFIKISVSLIASCCPPRQGKRTKPWQLCFESTQKAPRTLAMNQVTWMTHSLFFRSLPALAPSLKDSCLQMRR